MNQLAKVQNQFLESNSHLESFILSGFHQSEFYITGQQKDIDDFLIDQNLCLERLAKTRKSAFENNIHVEKQLSNLIDLHKRLQDSVKQLKSLYLEKGFKDFGTEGKMRDYAHALENLSMISENDLLQLRRHEKDYLLRVDEKYSNQFYKLIDSLLYLYPQSSDPYKSLFSYKQYFKKMVVLTKKLGINSNLGIFSQVQEITSSIGLVYAKTNSDANAEVNKLRDLLIQGLIGVSFILLLIVVFLSLFFANILTKDIKELNERMFNFIHSGFKEDQEAIQNTPFSPSITEVAKLNQDFVLLKTRLRSTLERLENAYEEAKKTSEYKSAFLANMSHEIRTPLNGVMGMVHLLKGLSLTEQEADYINTIDFSANHLLELINMILDYSKIEAGRMDLEHIPFDLKGDIIKLIKIFEYKAEEKGLELRLNISVSLENYLLGDPLRLQQVLINLLNNAVKFTNEGTIALSIQEVNGVDKTSKKLRFEVEDSGIGIEPSQIENLFQAFNQADNSISRNFGGTGLGLTISQQLVKMMGGDLRYTSNKLKGSKFSFELIFQSGQKILYTPESVTLNPSKYGQHKILLVEDNYINQKVISLMLQNINIQVDVASNGLEAIDMFEKNEYNLILMDIRMPKMDGLQATQHIKKTLKYQKINIPIVAVTANAFNEDRKLALDNGMDDFLSKPIRPHELEGVLEKYLGEKSYRKNSNKKSKEDQTLLFQSSYE